MTSPESASSYLDRVNWKTFVEYLTAEIILNRPAKPLHYVADLIQSRLREIEGREERDIESSEISSWLQRCYADAASRVDKDGIIHDVPMGEQLTD